MTADTKEIRDAGLKITLPRIKVLQILESSPKRHVSAEDVYKLLIESGEDIGLATVYRVLTQFEQAGMVTRHHFDGGNSVFEVKPDSHHDHIVCVKCGIVEEFSDEGVESRQKTIAKKLGFELTFHDLNLYGVCSECR